MAYYRGQDGSVQWAAGAVAQIVSWEANSALATVLTNVMGVVWDTFATLTASWGATVTMRMDYADTGQKAIVDALLIATPAVAPAAVQLRMNGATKYLGGNAFVTGCTVVQQLGSIIELRAQLTGTGPLTPTWS